MLCWKTISSAGIATAVQQSRFLSNCVFWSQIPANLLRCPEHEAEKVSR